MPFLIPLALAYIMLTLGLALEYRDFVAIRYHKKAFLTGLACQLILVPCVFFGFICLLNPSSEIAFGLMLISFCPGGVTSNLFTRMVDGNVALSIALTGVVSLLSVLTLPVLTATAYQWFFADNMRDVSTLGLGLKLFVLTVVPVLLGMLLRHYYRHWVNRYQTRFAQSATAVFVIILVVMTVVQQSLLVDMFSQIGWVLPLITLTLLLLAMLVARLADLADGDKRTLAIETSVQNGSVGIAVAVLIAAAPGLPAYALPSLLYGLLMNVVLIPFVWWENKCRRGALKPPVA